MVKLKPKQAEITSNIALTGLMGSGKTTIGKYLAVQLKRQFVDLDQMIEEQEEQSINEIFAEHGEQYFRKLEKKLLKKVLQKQDQIISLGGGTIIDDDNRELIKQKAQLVALVAKPKDLYARIKRRKNRPLLNNSDDPLQVLKDLWKERKPAYMESDIKIDTAGKAVNHIGAEIMEALSLKKPIAQEQSVNINRGELSYKIYYKNLARLNLSSLNPGKKVLIVSQDNIAKHYLHLIQEKLEQDFEVSSMIIGDGEKEKTFLTYQLIIQKLLSLNFERKDTLLALGGGLVGDLVGFAASTFYRGIKFVQVPTSFLAMIDSSVGGKTAINVPEGKNLVGSFYQPHMVHIATNCLNTLPDNEYKCGLGELVKYTLLGARWDNLLGDNFFDFVFNNADAILDKDKNLLNQIIHHCLSIKAAIVSEDETEKGIRAHLNLGHSFGHALEEITKYSRYSHGEAVAIGISCACLLAKELDQFSEENITKVIDLMKALNLSYKLPKEIKAKDMLQSFKYDKKVEFGKIKFIVPKMHIGRVDIVDNVSDEILIKVIENAKMIT